MERLAILCSAIYASWDKLWLLYSTFFGEKTLTNGAYLNFDEQNFDKLIVGFIGDTLRGKVSSENFDETLAIHQICQSFPLTNFCAIQYLLSPLSIYYIVVDLNFTIM